VNGGAHADSRTLANLILLGIANHAVLAGSRVVVTLDALSMGVSAFTVGVLISLYALLPMFLSVAAGRLVDRIGARRPMLAGSVAIGMAALHALNRPELVPVVQKARAYLARMQYLDPSVYRGGMGYDADQGRPYTDLSNSYMAFEAMRLTQDVEDLRAAGAPKADLDWAAAQEFLCAHRGKSVRRTAQPYMGAPMRASEIIVFIMQEPVKRIAGRVVVHPGRPTGHPFGFEVFIAPGGPEILDRQRRPPHGSGKTAIKEFPVTGVTDANIAAGQAMFRVRLLGPFGERQFVVQLSFGSGRFDDLSRMGSEGGDQRQGAGQGCGCCGFHREFLLLLFSSISSTSTAGGPGFRSVCRQLTHPSWS
jgi:hypothetical protein